MINERVVQALSQLSVPVHFRRYTGKSGQYITFFEYSGISQMDADDRERIHGHFVQVDIWSRMDYGELLSKVKRAMAAAGFSSKGDGPDMYEEETGLYHKPLRFFGYEEVEN